MEIINSSLSSQIIEILDDLAKRFGIAVDWTQANIIPYLNELAQKYINYYFWSRISLISIGFIISIFLLFVCKKVKKKAGEDWYPDGNGDHALALVGIIAGYIIFGVMLIVLLVLLPNLIACKVFPEKVLLDYIQYLLA